MNGRLEARSALAHVHLADVVELEPPRPRHRRDAPQLQAEALDLLHGVRPIPVRSAQRHHVERDHALARDRAEPAEHVAAPRRQPLHPLRARTQVLGDAPWHPPAGPQLVAPGQQAGHQPPRPRLAQTDDADQLRCQLA